MRAHARGLWVLGVLALGSCVSPRTQIVARFDTDMAQGPTGILTAMRVRVVSQDETEPRFDQRFELGVGESAILLPSELGIVPREATNRRVTVEADALNGDTLLFTRRTIATFATGRTLLLEIFLPDRCRFPENQMCPEGFTCGATGCEPVERPDLPEFMVDGGPQDGGTCVETCNGECVDTASDPRHCGGCGMACMPPQDGTATCVASRCGFACGEGFHACGGGCAADDDATACGSECTRCPAPPANGRAICEAGSCDIDCDPGFLDAGGTCQRTGAPQALAPISMGRASSSRPTFFWRLPALADGARVEVCDDPTCATVSMTFDAVGTSGTAPAALPSARYVYYWRLFAMRAGDADSVPSPTWAFVVPVRDETEVASTSWPLLFDIELDGVGDLAIGAPGSATVQVYPGGPSGPRTDAMRALTGAAGSRFGASVAGAGDVNGDGRADLLVGAPGAGEAHLFLGSPSGLVEPAVVLVGPASFGASVAPAGDVDGDGYADVVVAAPAERRVYLYRGGPGGLITTPAAQVVGTVDGFGASLAAGGDVDGDGRGDIVVGAPDSAVVFVYQSGSGGLSGEPLMLSGEAGSRFGASVAVAGDVDADGLSDLVVGAPGVRRVTIYLGALTGLATTAGFTLTETDADFGLVVAHAGDVDENAYDDVMVGSSANLVREYLSNRSGPGNRAGWNLIINAPSGATAFGRSIASAGFASSASDRFGDLLVGGSNAAYFYHGQAAGVTGGPALTFTGTPGSDLGASLD